MDSRMVRMFLVEYRESKKLVKVEGEETVQDKVLAVFDIIQDNSVKYIL